MSADEIIKSVRGLRSAAEQLAGALEHGDWSPEDRQKLVTARAEAMKRRSK